MRCLLWVMIVFSCAVTHAGEWRNSLDEWGQKTLEWENRDVADFISDVGVTSLVGGAFVAAALEEEHRWDRVAVTAGTIVGSKLINSGLKRLFRRDRPYAGEHSGYSFPSGHAQESGVAAAIICLRSDRMCAPAIGVAALTSLLRVCAGAHNLTDVGVGFGLGFAGGHFIPTLYKEF